MKKILGVVGSPRKNGNTHILVSIVLEGARAAGAKTELLFLNDFHIRECDGCHACWKTQECCKDDDMKLLYPKISDCDALVFGTQTGSYPGLFCRQASGAPWLGSAGRPRRTRLAFRLDLAQRFAVVPQQV